MCTPTPILFTGRGLKAKTKMWDVFPDDMGLDNNVELALANLDLNDPVLDLVIFYDGDLLEGSSFTLENAQIGLDIEKDEDGGESSGSDVYFDDYDMEDY
jgi:hypothetical protein